MGGWVNVPEEVAASVLGLAGRAPHLGVAAPLAGTDHRPVRRGQSATSNWESPPTLPPSAGARCFGPAFPPWRRWRWCCSRRVPPARWKVVPAAQAAAPTGFRSLLVNKWYVDELYDRLVVQPVLAASRFSWRVIDAVLIDGAVNGLGLVTRAGGAFASLFQTGPGQHLRPRPHARGPRDPGLRGLLEEPAMTSLLEAVAFDTWILHVLVWGPMAAMLHVLLEREERSGHIAFGWTLALFVLSLGLWGSFTVGDPGFQMASSVPWIEAWGVHYALGIDGISLFMVLLSCFTAPITILGSYRYIAHVGGSPSTPSCSCCRRASSASSRRSIVLLFYVFFELTLVPMYFIVGVWGGKRRIYAAVKFFLYTAVGSLLMLVGILYLYAATASAPETDPSPTWTSSGCRSRCASSSGCSPPSRSRSRSRCRCSRSTPGCRTRTWKPPRRARWCWPRSCSRWAPTGSCASCCRSSRPPPSTPRW